MRKTELFAILTVMLTMLISVNAFAADYYGETDVIEITGGIDMEKDSESTFDETRTITGKAECGTVIIINVYAYNEDDELALMKTYETEVGASGYFSKSIDLFEGENVIIIGTDDGSANFAALIKRKSEEIKNRLERVVCMPGDGLVSYYSIG